MRKHYFFDTSALVKLYHEEKGTQKLNDVVNAHNPVIVISDLTVIEMHSVLAKKVRTKEIDEPVFTTVIKSFQMDIKKFEVVKIKKSVKTKALILLKTTGLKRGLKTLDALQLAFALAASHDVFVVSDKILGEIAESQGLTVLII